ncbi:hypothetical protein [Xenorhabdus entomophaga]
MAKSNEVKLTRMSTICGPLLKENIGILDKEQINSEGFIDLIDDKN